MESKFLTSFKAARRVSTPLICVRTPDPAATINLISTETKDYPQNKPNPFIAWDIVTGLRGLSDFSRDVLQQALGDKDLAATQNPVEALIVAEKLPPCSVVFFQNAHKFVNEIPISQAVWNLRDKYKQDTRTLVMLCPQITLPAELANDVIVLDEPLPTIPELESIVKEQYENGSLSAPAAEVVHKATDALCGLAAFPAEQITAMAMSKAGVDIESLWERKIKTIENTPGISVWRGNEKLEDVKDCNNLIGFLRRYLKNVSVLVFMDEVEKAMGGADGDSSGVSQEMHGQLLSYMQDRKAKGVLLLGPPGTGKSMSAKVAGSMEGKLVVKFDLSLMKNSLVGESNQRLNACLKVIDAIAGNGKILFMATCNQLAKLSPEFRSRFRQGTFMFDLPSDSGRIELWKLYTGKFDIKWAGKCGFDDNGWTGREIETCCELAHDLDVSLAEASQYIVPVSRSSAEIIASLRQQASGRFISASKPGVYRYEEKQTAVQSSTGRKLNLAN